MTAVIRRNSLVRIGKGKKVYRVHVAPRPGALNPEYYLQADADHPDAAKRLPDAFRWYGPQDLVLVKDK